jgi:hypothetical protein
MNATTSPRLNTATVERIMCEHGALSDKLHRIHAVLSASPPDQSEIEELLREFLTMLIVHFSSEEDGDIFEQVKACAPTLAASAAKLAAEHRELLHKAEALCQFAKSGSPSMPWWRELQLRCHEFNRRFMQHECQENKLLHEAHRSDMGAE